MTKKSSVSIISKGVLAAVTVATASFGLSGLASANASISHTGYGSTNVISNNEGSHHDYWKPSNNQHGWQWDNSWNHGSGHQAGWNQSHDDWCDDDHMSWMQHDEHDWQQTGHQGNQNDRHRNSGGSGDGGSSTSYRSTNSDETEITNDNDVSVTSNVDQAAVSGDASSSHNTHGGSVQTGDAANYSSNEVMVHIDNSSSHPTWSGAGSSTWGGSNFGVSDTGYDSRNRVDVSNRRSYEVSNDNDVRVTNNVDQSAASGDASSRYNTWSGDVSTGSAMNWQSSSTSVHIRN